jgi:hypothetical protein
MLIVGLFLAACAYALVTVLVFGGPLQPIGLATFWSDRLGIPYWEEIALFCVAVSAAFVFALPIRGRLNHVIKPPLFVTLAILLPTMIVGLYAEAIRYRAVIAFSADEVEQHSFFKSISKAPEDFQFFLHTAALKDCKPYAWSYRQLGFYPLGPSVAKNVIPRKWMEMCSIPEPRNMR